MALIDWSFSCVHWHGSPVPNILSKSRGLADENKKFLTEWKWFETTVLDFTVVSSKYESQMFRVKKK